MTSARQFWADNSFYDAAGRDDGSAESQAVQRAEASLAEIIPALAAPFEEEVRSLMALLERPRSVGTDAADLASILQSADRIIDVAETLGYPSIAHAARRLRAACNGIDGHGDIGRLGSCRLAFEEGLESHRSKRP